MGIEDNLPIERLTPDRFSLMLESNWRPLWSIAAGVIGDHVGAEDVVQEAALIGLRKLDEFEPGTNFLAWMGSIVRFVALNEGRKRARRRAVSLSVSSNDPAGREQGSPSQGFDARVQEALGMLSETARMCLLLRTVQEMSYMEISAVLDLPEGTAMSHVHRARQTLRRTLASTFRGHIVLENDHE